MLETVQAVTAKIKVKGGAIPKSWRRERIAHLLETDCGRKSVTPAQIALAWLLAQKPWIVPIPGSRKLEHLDENIGSIAVELTPDDLLEIEGAISKITVQGDRYPKELQKRTGR